ncbi:MAG: polyprenyl synthetase family protein, partial [Rhodococcus sp. (in: high G+C Gram-positive bacteria)]
LGTDLSDAEVDVLRGHLIELGAVDQVERRITDLTDSALAALDSSHATEDAKTRLTAMAYTATRRTS